MAKELPYFKFEANTWDSGNIQMCSRESKGLFIDLCSLYWSRLGELPYALALQKLCAGNKVALQELTDNEIVQIQDAHIVIRFLDEQLLEFGEISEKRRISANKRWNANALQMESKSNARRGEERRGDKSNIYDDSFALFWTKYDKKVQPKKCKALWGKIPDEHKKIMIHLDKYTQIERQFRKDPERYLRNRTWEDEVILFQHHKVGNVDQIKL